MKHRLMHTVAFTLAGFVCAAALTTASAAGTTNQLIVRFSADSTAAPGNAAATEARLSLKAGTAVKVLKRTIEGSQVLRLGGFVPVSEAQRIATALEGDPEIAFAQPDFVLRPFPAKGNPPKRTGALDFESLDNILDLTSAWAISSGAPAVRIGVVDSGVTGHALLGRIAPGNDFVAQVGESGPLDDGRDSDARDAGDYVVAADLLQGGARPEMSECQVSESSWHGTSVAGVIAGDRDQALGSVGGVLQKGAVVPLRAMWKCGGYLSDVLDAIFWSAGISVTSSQANANPVQVINLSLGYQGECSPIEISAYRRVYEAGVVVIAAAGNDAADAMNVAPANCAHVIAVAAGDAMGNLANYSNGGSNVALMAPGGTAQAPLPVISDLGKQEPQSDAIGYAYGTSFAAAWVSGTVGLMRAVNPDLGPDGIWQMLVYSAKPNADCSGTCGGGMLNVAAAVRLAKEGFLYAETVFNFKAVAGGSRQEQVAPFTNLSGVPIAVQNVEVVGLHAAHFIKTADSCAGSVIADRGSCNITLAWISDGSANATAELVLRTDTPSGEVRVKVAGVARSSEIDQAQNPTTVAGTTTQSGGGCAIGRRGDQTDVTLYVLAIFACFIRLRGRRRQHSAGGC
jgi:serine protease